MLDPGRISKPQLFVVRKIIGDRNKLAKWQKMFVLTVTFTYFSFLPLSLVLLLLLFFTSATSACCGSLLSRVCCCVFDLSFFPPSPETFHLNILTLVTLLSRRIRHNSRHISWQPWSVTPQYSAMVDNLSCVTQSVITHMLPLRAPDTDWAEPGGSHRAASTGGVTRGEEEADNTLVSHRPPRGCCSSNLMLEC